MKRVLEQLYIRQLSFRYNYQLETDLQSNAHSPIFLPHSLPPTFSPSHIFSFPHPSHTPSTLFQHSPNSPSLFFSSSLLPSLQNSLDDIVTSYELQIELQNNTRNMRIDGNQALTDLSMFPRLRLTGASTITVHIDGVLVGFETPSYSVHKDVGQFQVCVVVVRPPESDPLNQTFSLSVSTSTGTAGTYVSL